MASEQDDTVFDQDLEVDDDDDDDQSSQSQNDDDLEEENDDVVLSENDEEEELLEEDDLNSNATVPTAVPSSSAVTVASIPLATPTENPVRSPKRQRVTPETTTTTTTTTVLIQKPQPIPQFDESRRLFQRLWTDEDEIELLQGFLEYTTTRGGGSGGGNNHHHHNDTALFYDQIKSKLQLDFNKNQLVEKLRRLKKKYRNVLNKINTGKEFSFKSPHDQATFEISRKIWSSTGKITGFSNEDGNDDDDAATGGNVNANLNNTHFSNSNLVDTDVVKIEDQKSTPRSRKRSRARVKMEEKRVGIDGGFVGNEGNVNNGGNNGNAVSMIEETVKSCLSPLFKELLSNAAMAGAGVGVGSVGRGIGGLAMNAMPLSFGGGEMMMMDEKWRKQHILELEVYSKRLELVQDQIRAQLDELRSMGE